MMLKKWFFLLCVCCTNYSFANTAPFDLFDSDRGMEKVIPIEPTPLLTPAPPLPKPPEPPKIQYDFELLGTSQIGSRFTAIMRTPSNQKLIQSWYKDRPEPIRGYTDYTLARVDPRRVQISYPETAPCRQSKPQIGLSCHVNGRMATLTMKRGKPTAQQLQFDFNQIQTPPKTEADAAKQALITEQVLQKLNQNQKVKPLTEAEKEKRKRDEAHRRELYKDFKRRVIKDEEVPPGQKVIRTPFGDRLVPIK